MLYSVGDMAKPDFVLTHITFHNVLYQHYTSTMTEHSSVKNI
jgi:hypothetical protein